MDRRVLLQWLTRAIGTACTAVVVVPGARYLIDPLRRRALRERTFQRMIRLDDLAPGVPRRVAVTGTRRDAWTLYAEETLGYVWLVRRTGVSVRPEDAEVDAFTTVCPHLGCAIGLDRAERKFACPCHQASFSLSGRRVLDQDLGSANPAPRDMDSLPCQIVADENAQEWWVEVAYQKFQHGLSAKVRTV